MKFFLTAVTITFLFFCISWIFFTGIIIYCKGEANYRTLPTIGLFKNKKKYFRETNQAGDTEPHEFVANVATMPSNSVISEWNTSGHGAEHDNHSRFLYLFDSMRRHYLYDDAYDAISYTTP